MSFQHFTLFLHLLGVIVWVGGMAFAYLCLRPAAAALDPSQRLQLWVAVFARFFPLVWISIALILLSGLGTMIRFGFGSVPGAWHWMMATGLLMVAVFVWIWVGPWGALKSAVISEDWARGADALKRIRQRVAFNLGLGIVTVAIATLGLGTP
ncbi:MAG TPA: CopD family protein [Rhodocyclaceae bacterium]|nr:CopD family protein [Rhodocyclaceae bacterium]HRQ47297.1 CopD family protein [Rhodocyclaceae bacterium]